MGLKIAILFGCLALVTCRTVRIEKTSLSLTEESQDLDGSDGSTYSILQNFLGKIDLTSGGLFLQSCSKGMCKFCTDLFHVDEVCFVATLGKDSIELDVTFDQRQFAKMSLKAPNPPKVCKKVKSPVKEFKAICVQVKNVDLKKASGCVYLSFEFKTRWATYKVECFKIPKTYSKSHEEEGLKVVQDESVLEFELAAKSSS